MFDLKNSKSICENAPEGATHYCEKGSYWLFSKKVHKYGSPFLFYSNLHKNWFPVQVTNEKFHSLAELKIRVALLERIESLNDDICMEIENRDKWEERATALAESVGEFFGVSVGEHSSANCPINNAHQLLHQQ